MIDTPKTDEFAATPRGLGVGYYQALDFARKLERERNALANRLRRAESILTRLADGYPVSVLDEATPYEKLGQRVLEYWKQIEKENTEK